MDLANIPEHLESRVIPAFAERIRRSIQLNFSREGRPDKWKKSKRVAEKGGQTLSLSGKLRNSFSYRVKGNKITIGTNIIYAKIHNFGGEINKIVTVKEHKRNIKQAFGKSLESVKAIVIGSHQRKMNTKIPKRQFMMIQREDIEYLKKIMTKM